MNYSHEFNQKKKRLYFDLGLPLYTYRVYTHNKGNSC